MFEQYSTKSSKTKKAYEMNTVHLRKFFVQESRALFVEALEPAITEKLVDFFVVFGDFAIFTVMLLITHKYKRIDISSLPYEKARDHIYNTCSDLRPIEVFYWLSKKSEFAQEFQA